MAKPYEIVIPLFNDEENLVNLLDSLIAVGVSPADIIVSMSGPGGNIDEITRKYNFRLIYSNQRQNPSIARNKGADHVKATYIVFLDSDVLVTIDWKNALDEICTNASTLLTGDTVHVSSTPNWLEIFWFSRIRRSYRKYINGANIVVEKDLFQTLSGFDESLESGEDYDFSMRSISSGILPVLDERLKVSHEGYPKSVKEFVKRERWHALGDLSNLKAFFESNVMIASALYTSLVIIVIVSLITASWSIFILSLSGCVLLSFSLTIYKMGWDKKKTLASAIVMNLYLAGRGLALIGVLSKLIADLFNRKRL